MRSEVHKPENGQHEDDEPGAQWRTRHPRRYGYQNKQEKSDEARKKIILRYRTIVEEKDQRTRDQEERRKPVYPNRAPEKDKHKKCEEDRNWRRGCRNDDPKPTGRSDTGYDEQAEDKRIRRNCGVR